jgi:elongation factor 2
MPRFKQTSEILKLMTKKEDIRNIGIIAHIDHGKTTMTDSLLAEAGLLSPSIAGQARALDYLEEEQKRGITIKTANISLLHEEQGHHPYLINLVDTPGHVDFTGKVTRALRAIDGAVVVVDAVEEVMVQTETVTRQAMAERVKPVLFINKIDRLIKELRLTNEQIRKKLLRIISDFNNLIELYAEPEFKNLWKVDPAKGSVAFGSALHRWGFTLETAQQKGIKFGDVAEFYQKEESQQLQDIIPLHSAILNMTINHLPNPMHAQKYRIPKIWKGDVNSEVGQAMLNCNDLGPTVMCVTMAQSDPHAGVVATGRLFSGEATEGDETYLVGAKKTYRIQQVSMYMGAIREIADRIDAGNIAALLGLEQARAGETLVDSDHGDVMVPFEKVEYISEPVITIALEPRNPRELQRLIEAMNRLAIEDPNLAIIVNKETGEYLLSGMGELHLEIAAKFLRDYASNLEIITSEPIVVFRESVARIGDSTLSKSPNRLNNVRVQVEPLEDSIVELIEKGKITEDSNAKQLAATLQKELGWSSDETANVLMVEAHRNVLINLARVMPFPKDAKDQIISGFKWGCQTGPLCEEPMRGVKVKLMEVQLHEDPIHRGAAQIIPATKKAVFGSFLTASPTLLEPVYRISVTTPVQWVGEVSSIINRKRGRILSSEQKGPITSISGYIPVAETFGLAAEMRSATSGHAFWQSAFDHWEKIPENVASSIIQKTRKRKGLPLEIPKPDKFIDQP